MDFHPGDGGWQLSRETAELLLDFANAQTATPTPTP
jgi:hypothetical protein